MSTSLCRYLMRISYFGTNFTGMSKMMSKRVITEETTIQGKIEQALYYLKAPIRPKIEVSSRTDAGVHALENSIHIDLINAYGNDFNPDDITRCVNEYMTRCDLCIVAKKTIRVPLTFHARFSAKFRTYLYRLAILRDESRKSSVVSTLPIEEWKRCTLIYAPTMDLEKFKRGAKLLEGYHDFESFKKIAKGPSNIKPHYRRDIISIDVVPGKGVSFLNEDSSLEYVNVYVKGRGFLHNQVRRMLGALVALGKGMITEEDIITMLQVPNKNSWMSNISMLQPFGLYLCKVEYDPEDLIFKEENEFPQRTEEEEECA